MMKANYYQLTTALIYILCAGLDLHAQTSYPQNYFRNPLSIPISLAGNFGECRPNHFHSGIDIKTEGKENLPVFATAEGYISRIKMDAGGFGHALYITHPNGYTTLYAHLNDFVPAVQQFLQAQQYAAQKWNIDVVVPAAKFPVKKGQQIAWSGNTGSSTAPHLHFEIRDTKTEHPLNPQLFGFAITDQIAPKPLKLFLYNGDRSISLQSPTVHTLSLKGNTYRTAKDTVYVSGTQAALGLHLYDYMNGSTNTLAYYTLEWYAKDALQGKITLDDIGYDVTRYLYAYCDHATMQRSGDWPILLFLQPGNALKHLYTSLNSRSGKISLEQGSVPIRMVVKDAYGNTSRIEVVIASTNTATANACEETVALKATTFERHNIKAIFPEGNFYDTACIIYTSASMTNTFSQKHTLMDKTIASHFYYDLLLKADKAVPFDTRNKLAVVYDDGKKQSGKAATFQDGWYTSKQRSFGSFWLVMDKEAPTIAALNTTGAPLKTGQMIRFKVAEKTTSVASFQVYCGGQWLCFEQRGDVWQYKLDKYCPKGKQTLTAKAVDENGNERRQTFTFVHL